MNSKAESPLHLNMVIRRKCCWNCLQPGHLRFQCPYPKRFLCSFCHKLNVLTLECPCQNVTITLEQSYPTQPVEPGISLPADENIIVIIPNIPNDEQDSECESALEDILEINAEPDSLFDI